MRLALEVLAAAQAVEKAGQRLFRPHGITVAQFNVLNLLADAPAGLRASDLAKLLIVDPSNITGLLKRMMAEGHLKEIDHPADRRQHIVALSAKGRRVWQAAARSYQEALDQFENGLTASDRAASQRTLEKIRSASSSVE